MVKRAVKYDSIESFKPAQLIRETKKALDGSAKDFEVQVKHEKDPSLQLSWSRLVIEGHSRRRLREIGGFRFREVLEICIRSRPMMR